jgi:hypothetical protein
MTRAGKGDRPAAVMPLGRNLYVLEIVDGHNYERLDPWQSRHCSEQLRELVGEEFPERRRVHAGVVCHKDWIDRGGIGAAVRRVGPFAPSDGADDPSKLRDALSALALLRRRAVSFPHMVEEVLGPLIQDCLLAQEACLHFEDDDLASVV